MERDGRKLALTPELADLIVGILQLPDTIQVACDAAGVTTRSYFNWIKRGKALVGKAAKGQTDFNDDEQALIRFFHATKTAQAVGRVELLKIIKDAAKSKEPKSWTAAAWLLERKFHNEFGRRTIRVESTGANGDPLPMSSPAQVTVIIEGDPTTGAETE